MDAQKLDAAHPHERPDTMTRIDSTRVKWRVQYRLSRKHAWKNLGLFETRERARQDARGARDCPVSGYGFGNVRVVRHISGKGKT